MQVPADAFAEAYRRAKEELGFTGSVYMDTDTDTRYDGQLANDEL